MNYEIILTEAAYRSLNEYFSSPVERVAFLFASVNETSDRVRLLVNEAYFVPPSQYVVQRQDQFVVDSSAFRHVFNEVRRKRLSIIVVHNHPGGILSYPAKFSTADLRGELAMQVDFSRLESQPHGAMVFGEKGSIDARVWVNNSSHPVNRVRVIGRQIKLITPTSAPSTPLNNLPEVFERQIRAFGSDGQSLLRDITVAVVGAGGTGSFVTIELAHLGVHSITILDNDKVEITNLNRLLGANYQDAQVGNHKVDVLERYVHQLNTGTVLETHLQMVDTPAGINLVRSADVIFCCTDNMTSRAILNQLAHQYYIPVIDMGVGLDSEEGLLTGGGGYTKVIVPEGICLQCNEDIVASQLAFERIPKEQRASVIQSGYASEIKSPSVISLNGVIASLAVTDFLNLLFSFEKNHMLDFKRYNILTGNIKTVEAGKKEVCYSCKEVKGQGHKVELWQI